MLTTIVENIKCDAHGGTSPQLIILFDIFHTCILHEFGTNLTCNDPLSANGFFEAQVIEMLVSQANEILGHLECLNQDQWTDATSTLCKTLVHNLSSILAILSDFTQLKPEDLTREIKLKIYENGGAEMAVRALLLTPTPNTIRNSFEDSIEIVLSPIGSCALQLIANSSFHFIEFQDRIRYLQGIPLVLKHLALHETDPIRREWAVFAIRNLLEDNLENQSIVSSLELQGVATNEQLEKMGMQVELRSGKVHVVNNKLAQEDKE